MTGAITNIITKTCPMCGKTFYLCLTNNEIDRYSRIQMGTYIQDLFPDFTPMEREMIKTGYCQECQEMLFGYHIENYPDPTVDQANACLKWRYGNDIKTIIEPYEEDDGSIWYRYWYHNAPEPDWEAFETVIEAFNAICCYLNAL